MRSASCHIFRSSSGPRLSRHTDAAGHSSGWAAVRASHIGVLPEIRDQHAVDDLEVVAAPSLANVHPVELEELFARDLYLVPVPDVVGIRRVRVAWHYAEPVAPRVVEDPHGVAAAQHPAVPRHGEVNDHTARGICKDLGIPPP